MNRKILMLTLLMAMTPGLVAGASVYKWTDENGVTHFGDRQPTGANSEQVNVRSGTTSRSQSGQRQSAQEQLGELQEQQRSQEQRRQETAVEEARRKQREANCATARSNLDVAGSGRLWKKTAGRKALHRPNASFLTTKKVGQPTFGCPTFFIGWRPALSGLREHQLVVLYSGTNSVAGHKAALQ
jgi:hypothetical protein